MYEMMAAELSSLNVIDSEVRSNLLKQIHRRSNEILSQVMVLTTLDNVTNIIHIKRVVPLNFSKKEQFFGNEIIRVI